jgi:hypothetical protein
VNLLPVRPEAVPHKNTLIGISQALMSGIIGSDC